MIRALTLGATFFSGYTYSRTASCCGCLTSNQNVLIHATPIKKANTILYSFTLRRTTTEKQ